MDINELKKQMIPYWRDIYNLQYGNIFKQLFVRIKYRIFGNRFGTSEIPDNILEAIARTMNLRHGKQNKKRKTKSDVRGQYGIVKFSKQCFCMERL